MDESGGDVGRGERRGCRADQVEQPRGILGIVGGRCFLVQLLQAVSRQLRDPVRVVEEGEALEGADADMAVVEAGQDR